MSKIFRIFVLLSIIMMAVRMPYPFSFSGDSFNLFEEDVRYPSKAVNISLSGRENVVNAANTVIYGEEFEPKGGKLGHWLWTGDINGDGLNDLAIAAPTATGATGKRNDGKVYIFFGDGGILPPVIDLKTEEPDVVIIGACDPTLPLIDWRNNATGGITNEISAGDYNGDGYRDLAVAFPFSSFTSSVFIIWGDENGLPSYIELNETMYSTTPPPHQKITGIGQAPGGDDLKVPNYLITEDLDGDGIDDLISGGHTGGHAGPLLGVVSIYWGGPQGLEEGVRLVDPQSASYFGWALDLGDIDNDGYLDMVVGAPWRHNTERGLSRAGSVAIIFNISRLKGMGDIDWTEEARCVIGGSGDYDEFGRNVELVDVNGDGYEDIIAAAPYADGIMDFSSSCGQIFMFKGGPELSFPSQMDAESDFDTVVIGPDPYTVEGYGGNPESIGEVMEIGDIDGDGDMEFAISSASRNVEPGTTGMRLSAGSVMLFEKTDLFPPTGGIVHLSHKTPFFIVDGEDMEDSLGFDLHVGDVDNDGLDDILIGAPGGDGPDNSRPYSGEAYIIRGCGLLIKDIGTSGRGSAGSDMLAGGHDIYLNVTFVNYRGASLIDESVVHLKRGESDIRIMVDGNSVTVDNDLVDVMSSIWGYNGIRGWLNITISLSWFFPPGDLCASVDMIYFDEVISNKEFCDKMFNVRSEFELRCGNRISVSGRQMKNPGEWQRSGSSFSIEDIVIVYTSHADVPVPEETVKMELVRESGGLPLDSKIFDPSSKNHLDGTLKGTRYSNFSVRTSIIEDPPPGYTSPTSGPPVLLAFNIDDNAPLRPQSLELKNSRGDIDGFSRDGRFELTIRGNIGTDGDPNGSGLKEYLLCTNGEDWNSVTSPSGLFGTYYSDPDFGDIVIERIDDSISFLEWGFWSPDDMLIPPDHFSARWHGYFFDPMNSTMLRLRGYNGKAMVVVDGETIFGWTEINQYGVPFGPIPATGSPVPVEIYYFHSEQPGKPEKAGIQLEYRDNDGRWGILEEGLHYPSKKANISTEEDISVRVMSVDWVDLISPEVTVDGFVDDSGPELDTSSVREWYTSPDPEVVVTVSDGTGSGLNISSMMMKLLPEGEQWTDGFEYNRINEIDNGSIEFVFRPHLGDGWRGHFRFEIKDITGNTGSSHAIPSGVDMTPPEISLVSPSLDDDQFVGRNRIIWKLTDGRGSGVVDNSIMMGYRSDIYSSDWTVMEPVSINRTAGHALVTFEINILRETNIEIRLMCEDRAGNPGSSGVVGIEYQEPPVNLPPVPLISSPANGSVFSEEENIIFDATGTTDDGFGEIRFSWYSSISGYLGNGFKIQRHLDPGTHEITLHADDGAPGHNMSVSIAIKVKEEEKDPPVYDDEVPLEEGSDLFFYLSMSFIAILMIGAVIIWLLHKKRSEDEISFRERNADVKEE